MAVHHISRKGRYPSFGTVHSKNPFLGRIYVDIDKFVGSDAGNATTAHVHTVNQLIGRLTS